MAKKYSCYKTGQQGIEKKLNLIYLTAYFKFTLFVSGNFQYDIKLIFNPKINIAILQNFF